MKRSPSDRIEHRFALLLVLLLFEPLGGAESPWARKPAAEWDKVDVHKILYDSPWVKHFTRTKRDLEFEVPDLGPSGIELRGYHAKESKEDGARTAEFYVRWVSSRTLRSAMARQTALARHVQSVETIAPLLLDDFEIAIAGSEMSAFEQVPEMKYETKCYLLTSSKAKIRPTHVEFVRSTTGRVRGIVLHFPRTTDSGEPLIPSHETRVWFFEGAAEIQISVMFRPQTMIDEKGLDL